MSENIQVITENVLNVTVTSNISSFGCEKRFSKDLTVSALKVCQRSIMVHHLLQTWFAQRLVAVDYDTYMLHRCGTSSYVWIIYLPRFLTDVSSRCRLRLSFPQQGSWTYLKSTIYINFLCVLCWRTSASLPVCIIIILETVLVQNSCWKKQPLSHS